MRNFLKSFLRVLAKRTIQRYRPKIIGVTGSVGKTTAKEAIYAVLSHKFRVRKNEGNFNNEFGVPMSVLDIDPSEFQTITYKLSSLLRAVWLAYGWPLQERYPKFLVLELAADKPGDIPHLVDMLEPQVGVVTAIGEVPAHIAFYASPEHLAEEKSKLIQRLPAYGGLAVLNYDDQTVLDMKSKSKAEVKTFGFSKSQNGKPDIWISDVSYFVSEDGNNVGGLSFKINHGVSFIPARIENLIGAHQLYGVMAAFAVGLHFGMNLVDISSALENMELPHGRTNLARGIKNSIIIDDTYNASPMSMHAALDTLKDFAKAKGALGSNGRRIAVLGNMLELGKYETEAHRSIGNLVAERCDILITVGAAGKLIADSAGNQMKKEDIISFDTSDEAKIKVQEIIKENDVILVKGSRAMKMENIVKEIAEL